MSITIATEERVICRVMGEEILTSECMARQCNEEEAEDCYGCSVSSRLCTICLSEAPLCPELDVCRGCLEWIAEEEARKKFDEGEIDGWQPALCCRCHDLFVYYKGCRLCVVCAAFEFAGITLKPDVPKQLKLATPLVARVAPDPEVSEREESEMARKREGKDSNKLYQRAVEIAKKVGKEKINIITIQKGLSTTFEKARDIVQQLAKEGLAKPPITRKRASGAKVTRARGKKGKRIRHNEALYTKARALVITEHKVSAPYLSEALTIPVATAREIMEVLREEGVIETQGRRSVVLVHPFPDQASSIPPVTDEPRVFPGVVLATQNKPLPESVIKKTRARLEAAKKTTEEQGSSSLFRSWLLLMLVGEVGLERMRRLVGDIKGELEDLEKTLGIMEDSERLYEVFKE